MIVSFLNFFMKSYVVGTHYNHIVDKILILLPQQQLLWRNKQRVLIAFYGCHSYWEIGLQKIHHRLSRKEKTTDHNIL